MQFPVPQFTDVEDHIIGPLTFKQFGIVFGAGVIVFLFFSVTKSIPVLIFFGILVGLPALGLAFGKINGRPMYNAIGYFMKYFMGPKVLVFHKEAANLSFEAKIKDVEIEKNKATAAAEIAVPNPHAKIKEINKLLEEKAKEEAELLGRN